VDKSLGVTSTTFACRRAFASSSRAPTLRGRRSMGRLLGHESADDAMPHPRPTRFRTIT